MQAVPQAAEAPFTKLREAGHPSTEEGLGLGVRDGHGTYPLTVLLPTPPA